jgi:ankyrin repeat protein
LINKPALILAIERSYNDIAKDMVGLPGINLNCYDDKKNTAIMYAIVMQNNIVLEYLIPRIDINSKNWEGNTILMQAIGAEYFDVVFKLLDEQKNSIDINTSNIYGATALMYASYKGYTEIVERLLGFANIDVNRRNEDGSTALIFASAYGYFEIVRMLLSHNQTQVNICNRAFVTALNAAIYQNHSDIAEILFQHGADNKVATKIVYTEQLLIDCYLNMTQSVKNIFKEINVDINFPVNAHIAEEIAKRSQQLGGKVDELIGMTALMFASLNNNVEVVTLFLTTPYIDINLQDSKKKTALMHTVIPIGQSFKVNYKVSQLLLQCQEIDVNIQDDNGLTFLMHIMQGNIQYGSVLRRLLAIDDIKLNAQDNNNMTALMYGIRDGNIGVLDLLKSSKIDPNMSDNEGKTALMYAIEYRGLWPLQALLGSGKYIDFDKKDRKDNSALSIAHKNGFDMIVKMIEKKQKRKYCLFKRNFP